jgi:hypothetical protein
MRAAHVFHAVFTVCLQLAACVCLLLLKSTAVPCSTVGLHLSHELHGRSMRGVSVCLDCLRLLFHGWFDGFDGGATSPYLLQRTCLMCILQAYIECPSTFRVSLLDCH